MRTMQQNNTPGTGIVEGVDEQQGHGTGHTTASNVGGELGGGGRIFGCLEQALDGVLEGKVQSLCGEVPQHVSQVS